MSLDYADISLAYAEMSLAYTDTNLQNNCVLDYVPTFLYKLNNSAFAKQILE